MLDINNTLDLVKLKFYNEWLYTAHLYDEGDAPFHKTLTKQVIEMYVDPLNLSKDATIIDAGCGPGYFMDEMKARGFTNMLGTTLSDVDMKLCEGKGHAVKQYDFTFLPQKDGFWDESVDFVFMRQALEHSPYPIFTLMEYNRLLKLNGKMYVEVPAPDCARRHEYNPNHYSILGKHQLAALMERTGFTIDKFDEFKYTLDLPTAESDTPIQVEEMCYCVSLTKTKPIDVK